MKKPQALNLTAKDTPMKGSTNLTGELEAHDESANSSFEIANIMAAGTVGYASYTL